MLDHRFHTLPRTLILHLKRFKIDMDSMTMRKIRDRVTWEKQLDVSDLCTEDARSPIPIPEPERQVAQKEALDASSDPQNLSLSTSSIGNNDDEGDEDLRRVLQLSRKEHEEAQKRAREKEREEAELQLATLASIREYRACGDLFVPSAASFFSLLLLICFL